MKTSDYPALFWRRRGDDAAKTELTVELEAPLDDAGGDLIDSTIEVFCTAAALGAFCEDGAAPGSCICRVLSRDRLSGRVQLELDCQGIDRRAFQVLRNMLAKLNEEGVRARELSIRSTTIWLPEDPLAPLIDEDNEDEAYPPLHREASLEVADDDVGETWYRRCVVYLRSPVGQAQVDALRSLASAWFDVLEAGGYAMPLDFPWDVECVGDTVGQFEEDSIEVTVLRFQASEAAWSALANLLCMKAVALGLAIDRVIVDA